ncbi:hypothetical protein DV532_25295 (plasmid) [Pseudomonas sp. Leaf58]|uniref:hypothetical protein n=1 Tax=Pseudomonas sp. Leaf58 TaxID=1736226 RepID=UPI0006F6A3B8|nr:hypothetical protein [Pseudomonas sp. Leaf58]AYG47617.1 hypothetical protein DV532_25295 [Pseudomonas sp. Leaf58]KQN62820.1 hypothetical protein ASF02_11800 [Pseudomonas sp. Leaf58]
MLVMFILGLILIAMLAVAAQSLSGMYSVLNDLEVARQERQVEMLWEASLSSLLVQAGPNGEFVAPLGAALTDVNGVVIGQGLPSAVTGPKVNARGYNPLYCALGRADLDGIGDTQDITLEPGLSYTVQTVTVGTQAYVTRSSAISAMERGSTSIAAFIISPFEAVDRLSCADIRYDQVTGQHTVAGIRAKVIPIFGANGGTLSSAEAVNRSSNQFIDASAYDSINDALAPYLSNPPARLTLNLPARTGGYQLTQSIVLGTKTGGVQSHLVIAGPAEGVIINGAQTLAVKNASLTLQNVTLDGNLHLDNASAAFSGSTIMGITAVSSRLSFVDVNAVDGPISLDASEVYQSGALSLNYGTSSQGPLTLTTSQWKTSAGTLSLTSGNSLYGIWIDQASRFVAAGSALTFGSGYSQAIRVASDSIFTSIGSNLVLQGQATTFLDVKGRADIQSGTASAAGAVAYGAVLRDGGELIMDNGQQWFNGGTAPAVGVSDKGGLGVAGSVAQIGGQVCWDGYLFEDSTAGQVTINDNKNLSGRTTASWSCSP